MAQRALLVLALFCLFAASAVARAEGRERAQEEIARLIDEAQLGDRVGVDVVQLVDGSAFYQKHATEPRNPASNQKLLTSAAALWNLGPTFRALTRVEGVLREGTVEKLIVRAAGDPSLAYRGVQGLADALRLRGVDRVEQIVIDDSYFDAEMLPPAFDQQPKEDAAFRAAIAAFSVDRNSYVVHVGPGPTNGSPGRVRVRADQYIVLENTTKTKASGPPKVWMEQRETEDGRLEVKVGGEVPATVRTLFYRRRVPDPRAHAASLWLRALQAAGIEGAKKIEYGAAPERLPVLGDHSSKELSALLYTVGKWSDNFAAEMILKIMGAEAETPGTSAKGVEVVRDELARHGVDTEALVMVNGSGLFDGNAVSPKHITDTLVAAYHDPAIRAEYVAQLAVGGADGTLQSRLKGLPKPRMVRAKTGTLRDTIALSGYVLGDPNRSFAFSILANGVAGRQAQARDLADAIVQVLAEYAAAPPGAP